MIHKDEIAKYNKMKNVNNVICIKEISINPPFKFFKLDDNWYLDGKYFINKKNNNAIYYENCELIK